MNGKVYYIGFYADDQVKEDLVYFPTSIPKMRYLIDVIKKLGFNVEVVSLCRAKRKFNKTIISIDDCEKHKYFSSKNNKFKKYNYMRDQIAVFFYLLKHLRKNDIVIVYHSLWNYYWLKWIRIFKRCKFIFEVEEIYNDVVKTGFFNRKKEMKSVLPADAYIFPTHLLNGIVNVKNKPYVLLHGIYENIKLNGDKKTKGKIKVVYGGTLEPRKGCLDLVEACRFLNDKYDVGIVGFGSVQEINILVDKISKIKEEIACELHYDGNLNNLEYLRYIQDCDIGICPQDPDAAFNATSFPSKILSYMANGLRVVSIRIPAIESSAIGDYMYYYDRQTPEEIAKAIMQVDLNDGYNGREIISKLDKKFTKEIAELINEVGK